MTLYTRGADGLLPRVVTVAQPYGLRDLSATEPTLETVFINLTGRELVTDTAIAGPPVVAASPGRGYAASFWGLMVRDAQVLRRQFWMFFARTVMQPFLIAFVFAYVFPRIGQGFGGNAGRVAGYGTILLPGLIAFAIMFQGVSSVALPLVNEFNVSKEIEDRAMAPLPTSLVAIQKIVFGALQALLAALMVFPCVWLVARDVTSLHVDSWLELAIILTLACLASASLGLLLGTVFAPQTVPLIFSLIVIPVMFLGCTYYPWKALEAIRWLQILVLVNPLVYVSEGLRGALTPQVPHMSPWVTYGGAHDRDARARDQRHAFVPQAPPVVTSPSTHERTGGHVTDWNFADIYEAIAATMPDAPCQVSGDRVDDVGRLRPAGQRARRRPPRRAASPTRAKVAAYLYNGPEYLETYFAAFKGGFAPVNTNYRYGPEEIVYLFDNADAEAVVFHATLRRVLEKIREPPARRCGAGTSWPTSPATARTGRVATTRSSRSGADRVDGAVGPLRRRPPAALHRRHHRHAQGRDVAPGRPVQRARARGGNALLGLPPIAPPPMRATGCAAISVRRAASRRRCRPAR